LLPHIRSITCEIVQVYVHVINIASFDQAMYSLSV